jgi:hypothetical protein
MIPSNHLSNFVDYPEPEVVNLEQCGGLACDFRFSFKGKVRDQRNHPYGRDCKILKGWQRFG